MTSLDSLRKMSENLADEIQQRMKDESSLEDFSEFLAGNAYRIIAALHDDAQCMALVKKFNLMVNWNSESEVWCMPMDQAKYGHLSDSPDCSDLNRAVVECVAKLRRGK